MPTSFKPKARGIFFAAISFLYLLVFLTGTLAVTLTKSLPVLTLLSNVAAVIRQTVPVFVFSLLWLSYERLNRGLFFSALLFSLPRLIFVFPDGYLRFFTDYSLATGDALLAALLLTVLDLAVATLLYAFSVALLHAVTGKMSQKSEAAPFSVDEPFSRSLLLFGGTFALYRLILSVEDSIRFFVENYSSFLIGDVLTAVLDAVVILVAFFVGQYLVFPVLRKLG